jgi:hypothetical protein
VQVAGITTSTRAISAVLAGMDPLTLRAGGLAVTVARDPSSAVSIAVGDQLEVVWNASPDVPNSAASGSLGGGIVTPVQLPAYLELRQTTTNHSATTPDALGNEFFDVALPILATPASPDQQFEWLIGRYDAGRFIGYERRGSAFDPATNTLHYRLSAAELQGTLLLPALVGRAYVATLDPSAHIYSGPLLDAADFGEAGPQFTRFSVVGPQVAGRLFVFNPLTSNYGWIEADGVGPVAVAAPGREFQ